MSKKHWSSVEPMHAKQARSYFLIGNPMGVRLLSRNTMVINMSNVTMTVYHVKVDPGNILAITIEIPAGEHRYICYADIGIQNNPDRYYEVLACCEGGRLSISPSEIRDNARIELNYLDGAVTASPIKGKMIAMNGAVIVMKSKAKKMIKLLWKAN